MQVKQGPMTGALDRAPLGVELAVGEVSVIVRTAILDRQQLAVAVEDPDLEVLPLDGARCARRELGNGADVDRVGNMSDRASRS